MSIGGARSRPHGSDLAVTSSAGSLGPVGLDRHGGQARSPGGGGAPRRGRMAGLEPLWRPSRLVAEQRPTRATARPATAPGRSTVGRRSRGGRTGLGGEGGRGGLVPSISLKKKMTLRFHYFDPHIRKRPPHLPTPRDRGRRRARVFHTPRLAAPPCATGRLWSPRPRTVWEYGVIRWMPRGAGRPLPPPTLGA